MIVNTNSWHYKVWQFSFQMFVFGAYPTKTNLCSYAQRIVFLAPLTALTMLFVLGILGILGPLVGAVRLLQIIVMLPFGYRPTGLDFQDYTKFTKSKTPTTQEEPKPSLLKEWIKAKKQKVCPLIEFEYE